MKLINTALEGVYILEPRVFADARGYFFESFSQRDFDALIRPVPRQLQGTPLLSFVLSGGENDRVSVCIDDIFICIINRLND